MTIASCNSNSLSNARNPLGKFAFVTVEDAVDLEDAVNAIQQDLAQDSQSNPSGKSTSTNQVKLDRFRSSFLTESRKSEQRLWILGNCSSNNYEWNERQVKQCFGLLFREFIHTARTLRHHRDRPGQRTKSSTIDS